MGTGGTIASILGAMLLGGMGKGMFQGGGEEEDSTKKLPSDDMTKVHFMKKQNVESPEPIDAAGMVAKQGLKPTFDNINRMSAGQMKEPAPLDFQPLSNEQLMGDPIQEHMNAYNYDGVGPDVNIEKPQRPSNVPKATTYKGMLEEEKMYAPDKRKSLKQMYAEEASQPKKQEEPGIMQKLISEILKGKKPNPEEPYTNRGAF